MRNLLFSFLLMLGSLSACRQVPVYPPELLQADSLAMVEPEQALALLASVEAGMSEAPIATQRYYQLLTVKAADKAYLPHQSDSLIRSLVAYYEAEGDPRLLPEAYYYAGRTYRDLNDAPQALDYFHKSLEAAVLVSDSSVNAVIHAQIGEIYFSQSLYEKALKQYTAAYRLDSLAGDTLGQLLDLRDMAFTHRMQHQPALAQQYLRQAAQLADAYDDAEMQGLIGVQLAGLYNQMGDYNQAAQLMEQVLPYVGAPDRLSAYDVYAHVLLNQGKLDEAQAYYEQLVEAYNLQIRADAYDGLANIAALRHETDRYQHYYNLYKEYQDSLQQVAATETVSRMNALYDYQLREKENTRLKLANQQQRVLIVGVGVVALLALLGLFMYYLRRRRQLRQRLARLQQLHEEQYRQSEAFIQANKQEIMQLQKQLDTAREENKDLVKTLESQKEELEHYNRLAEMKIQQREQTKKTIQESSLMARLHSYVAKGQHLGKKDVDDIERLLQNVYPQFLPYLAQLGEFSALEYEVCLLLKLGLPPAAISTLVLREKTTISAIRRRLYGKVTGIEGTPADWDEIILSL